MTKSKKTKKALLASVLSIMLCVAMLAGTTFAWFTDTAGSDNNRIKSGDLRIGLVGIDKDGNDEELSADALFGKDTKWEPGKVHFKQLKVVNEGELAAKFSVILNSDALKISNRLDPTQTEGEYTWTEYNLTEVINVVAYNGTFKELVTDVNGLNTEPTRKKLADAISELESGESAPDPEENFPAYKKYILGKIEGKDQEHIDNIKWYLEELDKAIRGVSEFEDDWHVWVELIEDEMQEIENEESSGGADESGMPNPEGDWNTYLARVRAEVDNYSDNYKETVSQYLRELDDAIAAGDETEIEFFKQLIIDEVTSYYNSLKGEAEDEERMLQIFEEALASLQAHSGKEYTEKDRDVVTVALALYYLGEHLDLQIAENFMGKPGESALLEDTLERKGATRTVPVTANGETTDETTEVPTDERVFTLIAFWPERGEDDNDWNLNNGRKATVLMNDKECGDARDDALEHENKYDSTKGIEDELQIEFDILVLATQAPVENDSFGADYDKDAWDVIVPTDGD